MVDRMRIGLDIGSTTIKCVAMDEEGTLLYQSYERHFSQITQKTAQLLTQVHHRFPQEKTAKLTISGSAGMGMADSCGIPFVQGCTPPVWRPKG